MHKEIDRLVKENKFYLDFLEKFDREKTKTFSRKKDKTK